MTAVGMLVVGIGALLVYSALKDVDPRQVIVRGIQGLPVKVSG